MSESCYIRTQLSSDGTLRTWKWPMALGEGYYGDKVEMTITKVKLTQERKEDLQKREANCEALDTDVRNRAELCWAVGAPFLCKMGPL